ncbi:MAG: hypothetical protein ACR2P5_03850 [Gammaproteobacteria bacterium]
MNRAFARQYCAARRQSGAGFGDFSVCGFWVCGFAVCNLRGLRRGIFSVLCCARRLPALILC